MDGRRLIAAAAANMAAWHDVSVRALGGRTALRDGMWLAVDQTAPIYFDVIVLDPATTTTEVASVLPASHPFLGVSDPFGLDLAPLGFARGEDQPWFVRQPRPLPEAADPPGLEITLVADDDELARWEAANIEGFRGPGAPVARHSVHAPAILDDPRMRTWLVRLDGRIVSGTMTFVEAGVAAIYSTSTVPSARRRGYSRALALRSLAGFRSIPVVVQPSSDSEPLYRGLGFEPFATFASWFRRAGQAPADST
jgi:hypothetical protein